MPFIDLVTYIFFNIVTYTLYDLGTYIFFQKLKAKQNKNTKNYLIYLYG